MTIWLACGQATPTESKTPEVQPVLDSTRPMAKMVQEEVLIEGTLFFMKSKECMSNCIAKVTRQFSEWTPQIALEKLYKGPANDEKGLRFLNCGSTSAKIQSVEAGIAKVQLEGGCGGCGVLSTYDLILPTLKAFPEINVVHVYDPNGKSQVDGPNTDSRPACLEP